MIRKRRLDYESPSVPTHQSYKQLPHDQKSMDYHSFIVKRQTILLVQREEKNQDQRQRNTLLHAV